PRERATSVPVIQSSMTSGADSSPAVVVHARPGARWELSDPYILDLVAVLPEVITQLTADPAASSVVGGLETLDQVLEW
ncbi:hypothetical protein N0441_05750, partial [Pseudomonas aeruginosa]|nr:hypothetical protein [Pseudomonas aeruginosa]MCS8928434.1 hypothetical protein [Pseudomonas aeruginosa]